MMKSTGSGGDPKDIEILIPGCGNSSKQLSLCSNTILRYSVCELTLEVGKARYGNESNI